MTPRFRYAVRASCDVDEHASCISAWSQEYDQLSHGRFQGSVRELWMDAPRLQVFHEHTSQQTSQRCLPWNGAVWFGIPDGQNSQPLHFSGRLQPVDRERIVMAARAGDGFALRTPQNFGIYGVVVDEAWLCTELERLGLEPCVLPAGRAGVSLRAASLPPYLHVALCQTIEAMLSLGACGDAALGCGAPADLAERLLGLLAATARDTGFSAQVQSSQRCLASVMTARALVAHPLNYALSVDDLCEQLHLTPRTLQNHFRSAVGESPAEFLRAVRLNACRRELRACVRKTTVQDVAAQWGFFHMGRFSHEYKAMFDELPSQTLRQARALH